MTESSGGGGGSSRGVALSPPAQGLQSRAEPVGVRMKEAPEEGDGEVGVRREGGGQLFRLLNPNWRLDEMHGKTPS